SELERAPRELRAFRRVELKAHSVRTLLFEIPLIDLAVYEPESRSFRVEPLEYVFHVGTSASDLPLSTRLRVQ
ncbi:MAG TPA: fibronectin type III-like domain-contianing protein, partial [Polyangiaceae bacterium]|nr:fibronectin type III-like domain-contianing protein [Polyangiaceae bacterium]